MLASMAMGLHAGEPLLVEYAPSHFVQGKTQDDKVRLVQEPVKLICRPEGVDRVGLVSRIEIRGNRACLEGPEQLSKGVARHPRSRQSRPWNE